MNRLDDKAAQLFLRANTMDRVGECCLHLTSDVGPVGKILIAAVENVLHKNVPPVTVVLSLRQL